MRARKAGGNGAERSGAAKNGHAKPRAGSKSAVVKPAQAAPKETAPVAVKKTVAAANGTGSGVPAHRPETGNGFAASTQPRGNPPPLPAPIASFNF
jgi:hypothetical protein